MSCVTINERRLFDFVDGSLTGITHQLMGDHLAVCSACQVATSDFQSIVTRLRGGKAPAPPSRDDPWQAVAASLASPDWLVLALADAVVFRDSVGPLGLVMQHREWLSAVSVHDPNGAARLAYLAVWLTEMGLDHFTDANTDLSYMEMIESAVRRFPRPRPRVATADCFHLELASALVALHNERNGEATDRLLHTTQLACEVGDPILTPAAYGALGKAYARQGGYTEATRCAERAIAEARRAGYPELAAAHQTRLAWTLFQMHGQHDQVSRLLAESEELLAETEDRIGRGNIASAQAKIASHNGHYETATVKYGRAIALYEEFWPGHPNLARALLNRSKARLRTVARLRRMKEVAVSRTAPSPASIPVLLQAAEQDIDRAAGIYRPPDIRGRGSVHLATAFLRLNAGEVQRAALEAASAYDIGRASGDRILLARARVMQCHVCIAESYSEDCEPRHRYRLLETALSFSDEAIEDVKSTQHRRLATTAWLARGLVLAQECFGRREEAVRCLARMRQLLPRGTHDYLKEQVDELARLLHLPDVPVDEMVGSVLPGQQD